MIKAILKNQNVWHNTSELLEYIDNHTVKEINTKVIDDSWINSCEIHFTVKYIEGSLTVAVDRVEVSLIMQEWINESQDKEHIFTEVLDDFNQEIELELDDDAETFVDGGLLKFSVRVVSIFSIFE